MRIRRRIECDAGNASRDDEGEIYRLGWIFRGHKRESYALEPSIERAHPSCGWAEVEYKIMREFQSRARMHLDPGQIPQNPLAWLALMQHYGAPTRLLDFTYSPYVALYFALRNRGDDESGFAEVWAFDEAILREQAASISSNAPKELQKQKGQSLVAHKVSSSPRDAWSALQEAQYEEKTWDALVQRALNPGILSQYFHGKGFVVVAMPPLQNPRLSSQQGVFLFNGAEELTFESSLERMMEDVDEQWYKRFRIPTAALSEMEEQLFNFNIHDLSLFPDLDGLVGFVRQKARLHW